jgi:hypothetical protein
VLWLTKSSAGPTASACKHSSALIFLERPQGWDSTPTNPPTRPDNCEIIRAAHDGWDEESEKLTEISLLCSGCYERARIRNTRPSVTLDDLADLRWKCGSCDEWHTGPCLDFGYDSPHYWSKEDEKASKKYKLLPSWSKKHNKTFLTEDYCVTDDGYFYVRGLIHLPIIGAAETFRWGVWESLSRENFNKLREMDDNPSRIELPSVFSWLSSRIPEYSDTLSLKMYAHIQDQVCAHIFFWSQRTIRSLGSITMASRLSE